MSVSFSEHIRTALSFVSFFKAHHHRRQKREETMLNGFLDSFLLSRSANGCAASTVGWYRRHLASYLSWLADNPHCAWDAAESIEQFLVTGRSAGLRPNSIHARYRALSVWFSWLLKRHHIAQSPIAALDAPRQSQDPVEYVRLAEYERLLRSINGPDWIDQRDRCLLYLLFWCGLRVSEACGLCLGDIDLAAKLVTVRRGKGGKGRVVPCGADLGTHLLSYLMMRPVMAAPQLFLGSDGNGGVRRPLSASGVRQMLERRCEAARMRPLSPHKFRHGFAMTFLNAGMDMSAVSKTMGHSTQAVTADRYAKWLTDGLSRQYAEVRNRLLSDKTE
jgi:integrase/recombinase XerD